MLAYLYLLACACSLILTYLITYLGRFPLSDPARLVPQQCQHAAHQLAQLGRGAKVAAHLSYKLVGVEFLHLLEQQQVY